MFNQSKYTKWYFCIVDNARTRATTEGYVENHHIIPKSLGGSRRKDNLVRLTGREHLLCHFLLEKMMIDPEHTLRMGRAVAMMLAKNKHSGGRERVTGRRYQHLREISSRSSALNDPNIRFNPARDATQEYRDTMAEAMTGREVPWRVGAKDSDETRARKSASGKTKIFSDEHHANLAKAAKERWARKRAEKLSEVP